MTINNIYIIYIGVAVISPGMHIYIYIYIYWAQSEEMNSLRTGKHLPKNSCW